MVPNLSILYLSPSKNQPKPLLVIDFMRWENVFPIFPVNYLWITVDKLCPTQKNETIYRILPNNNS